MKRAFALVTAIGLGSFLACDDDTASSPPPAIDGGLVSVEAGSSSSSGGPQPDASPTKQCSSTNTQPTEHRNNVDADETWTAKDSPHVIPNDITINKTVTLEPCAVLRIGESKTVSVVGALVAKGTEFQPVSITAQDAAKPFARIRGSGGTIDLAYTTVSSGGDPQNALPYLAGMIDMQGKDNSAATQALLKVSHVTVAGSKSNGIVLRDGAGFADPSSDLIVKESALHPVSIWARAMGTLPPGTYTGNTKDLILIPAIAGHEQVRESTTMHNRGIPYLIGHDGSQGTLYVGSGKPEVATLTIEPGATLKFKKGGLLSVEPSTGLNPASGALIAKGGTTKETQILFTSAEATPAAGDWMGIWFGQVPNATDAIDHARVEYAGGASASGGDSCAYAGLGLNDAAIRIFGVPASAFVTNTEIVSSAKHGIDRGFRSDSKTNFLPTNTFTAVAGCKQSFPRDANGACPGTVPCEK